MGPFVPQPRDTGSVSGEAGISQKLLSCKSIRAHEGHFFSAKLRVPCKRLCFCAAVPSLWLSVHQAEEKNKLVCNCLSLTSHPKGVVITYHRVMCIKLVRQKCRLKYEAVYRSVEYMLCVFLKKLGKGPDVCQVHQKWLVRLKVRSVCNKFELVSVIR